MQFLPRTNARRAALSAKCEKCRNPSENFSSATAEGGEILRQTHDDFGRLLRAHCRGERAEDRREQPPAHSRYAGRKSRRLANGLVSACWRLIPPRQSRLHTGRMQFPQSRELSPQAVTACASRGFSLVAIRARQPVIFGLMVSTVAVKRNCSRLILSAVFEYFKIVGIGQAGVHLVVGGFNSLIVDAVAFCSHVFSFGG
jgi:hypothetical protein